MANLSQLLQIQGAQKKGKNPSAQDIQCCLNEITAGAGYVPPDGSERTCGDLNGSGLVCFMYHVKPQRCHILGPDLKVTPSMTCIHQLTGTPIPDSIPPIVAGTAVQVGLVDTKKGALCHRCKWFDQDPGEEASCYWLSQMLDDLLGKNGFASSGAKYYVEENGCCSFWENSIQELIK
ncbi:MAG: hypothetical protein KGI50_07455 [Patescibacteria group bacterium]|nr:hypothetical protein [Patescibacteria group bacterium]MDE2439165.1 hypothetical protein [Patescibacteria group bacterium]